MSYLQGLDIEIDPDMFGCRQQEIGKRSIGQVVSANRINGLELHFVTWITAIKGRRLVVDVAEMACDWKENLELVRVSSMLDQEKTDFKDKSEKHSF